MVVSFTLTHCASSLYHSEVFLFHVAIMKNGFPITVTTIIEVISKNYIIKINKLWKGWYWSRNVITWEFWTRDLNFPKLPSWIISIYSKMQIQHEGESHLEFNLKIFWKIWLISLRLETNPFHFTLGDEGLSNIFQTVIQNLDNGRGNCFSLLWRHTFTL